MFYVLYGILYLFQFYSRLIANLSPVAVYLFRQPEPTDRLSTAIRENACRVFLLLQRNAIIAFHLVNLPPLDSLVFLKSDSASDQHIPDFRFATFLL